MTLRSVLIGFLLGVFVAAFTYFNNHVISQTFFIGYQLPLSIFGFLIILVVFINPLLRKARESWMFKPAEIAIIVALGLATCGWPGGSFFRFFTNVVSNPNQQYASKANWQTSRVLSYVPGGSSELAEGFVKDWTVLARKLTPSSDSKENLLEKQIWEKLPIEVKSSLERIGEGTLPGPSEKSRIIDALNDCLIDKNLFTKEQVVSLLHSKKKYESLVVKGFDSTASDWEIVRSNRIALEALTGNAIITPPHGSGILLSGGNPSSPAATALLQGLDSKQKISLYSLPWKEWAPTISFWAAIAILFGIASLMIVIIVQPQWKRELLPYPIARFVNDITETSEKSYFPKVAQSKLFWYGLGIVFFIHIVNGLYKWFPQSIKIPLLLNFDALWSVLPQQFMAQNLFSIGMPTISPIVIAFTFFLNTQVSFSVGISGYLYAAVYAFLFGYGITVSNNQLDPANFSMMRFGAYVGCAMMIFYLGRKYYVSVLGNAIGLIRNNENPTLTNWATRGVLLCFLLLVIVLTANGLDWPLSIVLTLIIMMFFLVVTRIVAETGLFFLQPYWFPAAAMLTIFGAQALGPVAFFIIVILSVMFTGDMRETIMPYLANAVYIVTDKEKQVPRKGAVISIATMIIIGFFVALTATIYLQYVHGMHAENSGSISMDLTSAKISELSSYNELSTSMNVHGLDRFTSMRPMKGILGWAIAGALLYIGCSFLRTTFSWWPFHPVLFLLWGTFYPSNALGASILIGWFCKVITMKFGGAKGYHAVKPFMVGAIAGELIGGLLWILIGVIYYLATGMIPKSYSIFDAGWN